MSVCTPYPAPPLLALFHRVVEIRLQPDQVADSTSIGGDFSAIGLVGLPVLVGRRLPPAACCLASSSARSVVRQLITPPSQIATHPSGCGDGASRPTDDPDHKRPGNTRFKAAFGEQVKEYAECRDSPVPMP